MRPMYCAMSVHMKEHVVEIISPPSLPISRRHSGSAAISALHLHLNEATRARNQIQVLNPGSTTIQPLRHKLF